MKVNELVLRVATKAHQGQVDKAGKPYIDHPKMVASLVESDKEKAVAYLHDVVEDISLTLQDLENVGFPLDVIETVRVLTKESG